jgi:pilus assembly protein FimV
MRVKHIISSVSIAIGLAVQFYAFGAGLGKMTVNSALGQPLNADIVILVPDATELKNLHANLASQAAYQQAGLDMSAVLENIKFIIKSQPDGTALLHLSSSDPVQDPFLDIMVELEWGNGKIERDYTLLLDPPNMQHAMVSTPSVPPVANVPVTSSTSQQQQTVGAVSSSSRPTHRHAPAAQIGGEKATNTKIASAKTVKVHTGMTLSGIAGQYKPEGVHLEQMLVGLYRENPQAFEGNMNRMRSGQILHIPDRATLAAIGEAAAVREVHLQAEDWHAYRQKLAGEVERSAAPASQNHQAGGKIAPAVQDKSAAPVTSGGMLKLSKGAAPKQGQTGAAALSSAEKKQMAQDDVAAKQKAMEEEKTRLAMLEKNAQDMQRLLALKNQQLAAQKAASAPVPTPAPAPVTPTVAKPVLPHHPLHKLVKPAPVPVPSQPAWYERIDPLYVAAVGGVMVLLGLLVMVINSRKRRAGLSKFENSILTSVESKPNTVYNTQSGASVNTSNTSFLTDFSQSGLGTLDTHDVDPIAEAEVYMAYGRDVQAEEILKEAMQKEPQRHEIKVKLLEIYAGRNNLPAFEAIATDLYSALAGQESPLWDKAAEMGRKLDPRNPLYGGSSVTPVNEAPAEVKAPVIDEMLTLDEEPIMHPMDKVADLPDGSDELAPEPHDLLVSDEHDAGHGAGHDGDTDAGVWDVSADNTLSGALDFDLGLSEEKKPVIDEMPNIADHEEFTLPAWAAPVEADTETAAVADDITALDLEMSEEAHESMPEAHEALLADDTATSMDHTMDHAELPTDELSMDMAPITESLPEIAEEEPYQQISHPAAEEEDLPEEMSLEMSSDISLHDQPVMLDFSGIDLDLGEKQPQEEQLAAPAASETQTEDMHVDTQVDTQIDTQIEQEGAKPSAPVELSPMEQEIKTKLELAQVYHEMGDSENAREILQEVLEEGDEAQRAEAQALMQTIANA